MKTLFNIIFQKDNSKQASCSGFTMIELMVTIFVVMVGLIGVFIIAQHPFSYIQPIFSQLTAAYLAQEGVEIVRNLRDENWLDLSEPSPNWYEGLGSEAGISYEVSYDGDLIDCGNCEFDDLQPFRVDEFYSYSSGVETKFKRKVTITQIDDPSGGDIDYLEVEVLIEWEEKGKRDSFLAQENLYPWWPISY